MTQSPFAPHANPVTFAEPREGTLDEFDRLLHRISRSPAGRAGLYGDMIAVTTLDEAERDLLESAVGSARIGDRVAILGGVTRGDEDGEESLQIDPLTEAEAALLAEVVEVVLPTIIGEGAWRAQIVSFPVPFDAFSEGEEVEDDEIDAETDDESDDDDEDGDGDEDPDEDGDDAATDDAADDEEEDGGAIGAIVLVRLLRVA